MELSMGDWSLFGVILGIVVYLFLFPKFIEGFIRAHNNKDMGKIEICLTIFALNFMFYALIVFAFCMKFPHKVKAIMQILVA